jgi:hypothetical protein
VAELSETRFHGSGAEGARAAIALHIDSGDLGPARRWRSRLRSRVDNYFVLPVVNRLRRIGSQDITTIVKGT